MNVNPIPTLDERINDIRMRTAAIVNEEILPNEAQALDRGRSGDASDRERARGAAAAGGDQGGVRKAGLWAPHLPKEYGGMGLDFLAHAYMNEVLAYGIGAGSAVRRRRAQLGQPDDPRQVRHRGAEAEVAAAADRGQDGVRASR